MNDHSSIQSRRKFLISSATTLGATSILSSSLISGSAFSPITINQVIEMVKKEAAIDTLQGTVDTIKIGDGAQAVKGIVTTMFATIDVIRKAIELKANFIIAHEPTFYNHADEVQWLEDDAVYQYKRDLVSKHNLVIWRLHDYIHSFREDGILMGVLDALGWRKYYDASNPLLLSIPSITLRELVALSKDKLQIEKLRYIGDLDHQCQKVSLLPGAWGGRRQIATASKEKPDVLICGELSEWETSEYIRDARAMGRKQSLIVLGHAVSEEPGMEWLMHWLQPRVPAVKITHLPSQSPFSWG